jgi:DNA-binding NarL/FixJ family response regulator
MIQQIEEMISVYVVEEQEIYREVYKSIFSKKPDIRLLQVTANDEQEDWVKPVSALEPDILLISVKKITLSLLEKLEQIKSAKPAVSIITLLMHYNAQDIDLLRRLALSGEGGMALFMKHSLDKIEQLYRTIVAVSQGQVILDPPLAAFMFAGKPECPFLKQLTYREMEILGLLSQGYTNAAIAEALYIDIKTVEHHLNSMYSKLKTDPGFNDKHLRVSAARLYLETMGELYQREETLTRSQVYK